jgi:hypothetical protein
MEEIVDTTTTIVYEEPTLPIDLAVEGEEKRKIGRAHV